MQCSECQELAFACSASQTERSAVDDHLTSCDKCHAWHHSVVEHKTKYWVSTNPVVVRRLKKLIRTHCCGCSECKGLIRDLTTRFDDQTATVWLKTMVIRVIYALTRDMLFGFEDPDFDSHLRSTVHRMLEDHATAGYA